MPQTSQTHKNRQSTSHGDIIKEILSETFKMYGKLETRINEIDDRVKKLENHSSIRSDRATKGSSGGKAKKMK